MKWTPRNSGIKKNINQSRNPPTICMVDLVCRQKWIGVSHSIKMGCWSPFQTFRFPRAGGEPPRRIRSCGVSPVPHFPQESSRLPLQSLFLNGVGRKKNTVNNTRFFLLFVYSLNPPTICMVDFCVLEPLWPIHNLPINSITFLKL